MNSNDLLKQLYEKPFRKMIFGIYNIIDDDGFVKEISSVDKKQYCIDDFHFLNFDISDDARIVIKNGTNNKISEVFDSFKHYVENKLQTGISAHCRIYKLKEYGALVAVKPCTYNLPQ